MSMPIYLMFIRVLLSVEFCFTLKTYLKGAPFYNASASRRSPLISFKARFGPSFRGGDGQARGPPAAPSDPPKRDLGFQALPTESECRSRKPDRRSDVWETYE